MFAHGLGKLSDGACKVQLQEEKYSTRAKGFEIFDHT